MVSLLDTSAPEARVGGPGNPPPPHRDLVTDDQDTEIIMQRLRRRSNRNVRLDNLATTPIAVGFWVSMPIRFLPHHVVP